MPLTGNIKNCIGPFQVPLIYYLIKTPIFLYREEISIFFSYSNMLQVNIRTATEAIMWFHIYAYIIFSLHLKQVPDCMVVSVLDYHTGGRRSISARSHWLFYFSELHRNVSSFFEGNS